MVQINYYQTKHIYFPLSSCIYLLFTDQPNLFDNSNLHSSYHTNCHPQITFCNLDFMTEYPSPYDLLTWAYKSVGVSIINAALNHIDQKLFFNKIRSQQNISNQIVNNTFSTFFVPNKFVTFLITQTNHEWQLNIKNKINYHDRIYKDI